MPHVRVLSTGGTIASTDGADGATPSKDGDDLVAAVPGLEDVATIDVESVCDELSFHLSVSDVAALVEAVERADEDGVDGVVVTHGTDTMEESSYYVDMATDADVPVVFTGAQRPADWAGADGPANLLQAVRTAADDRFEDGAYVAFGNLVHAARWVTKARAGRPEAYASPDAGPVAELTADGLSLRREPGSESVSLPATEMTARVEMLPSGLDVDARQLERALEDGVDGLVLAASGIGNTTPALGDGVAEAVEAGVPVVVATRCYDGAVGARYGGPGGSRTVREHGTIPAGDLPPWKARIKLGLALSAFDDPEDARGAFEAQRGVVTTE
ncbi:asparaginase [Natronococcus occultus]|uniref:L-asparaginase/GlutRNAGln amidotransferase subunit D n=1 Tax=Natronococcus occultus SP4 TaxID=694430 RepID=L0K718_9EURY|nr:asparaginase [Natronococcus occultus]AGB39923.1 L-asparaginase/GlutRNAGln amidotransferase subunit D [Natronococcus occultus SP4]